MDFTSISSQVVILCFKDDERKLNLKHIKRVQQQAEVICVSEPSHGLETLASRQVAMVIYDPNMKKMDGLEFIKRVRTVSPDTVRVLINCSNEPDLIVNAIDQGKVWKCITWPWETAELDRVIEEGLEYWKRMQKQKERPVIERPDFYLQLVKKITDLLNQSENLDYILKETVNIIESSLHYDVVSIYLWDEQTEELVLKATRGLNLDPENPVRLKSNEGLTGYVYQTRRSLVALPASRHQHYKYIPGIGEENLESYTKLKNLMVNLLELI